MESKTPEIFVEMVELRRNCHESIRIVRHFFPKIDEYLAAEHWAHKIDDIFECKEMLIHIFTT